MLDTRFPRLPGDVGCPESFDPPAMVERVGGARVADAVTESAHEPDLVAGFVTAARKLHRNGADLIVTSCGFLSPLQTALEAAVPVPVVSSVLVDLPLLRSGLEKDDEIGILTFDSRKLGEDHLPAEFGPYRTAGLETGNELYRVIAGDLPTMDHTAAMNDALTMAKLLIRQYSRVKLMVLECTNLPPYQQKIANSTGLQVYSIQDAVLNRIRMLVDPTLGG
jgi:hypothetical protein